MSLRTFVELVACASQTLAPASHFKLSALLRGAGLKEVCALDWKSLFIMKAFFFLHFFVLRLLCSPTLPQQHVLNDVCLSVAAAKKTA